MREISKIKLTSGPRITEEVFEIKAEYKEESYVTASVLLQSYPNPTNGAVWIPYRLANDASVEIRIYNILGQMVQKLDLGTKPKGNYLAKDKAAYWNACNQKGEKVARGLYFYQLKAGDFSAVGRMAITR